MASKSSSKKRATAAAAAGSNNNKDDDPGVDITALVLDCAEHFLTVKHPFLSDNYDCNNNNNCSSSNKDGIGGGSTCGEGCGGDNCGNGNNNDGGDDDDDVSSFTGAFFNLHDAMAASQLMDRKMDSCEIPAALIAPWRCHSDENDIDDGNKESRMVFPRPIPVGLDDPMAPLPWRTLTVPQAAHICLEILVRLQSLLSGSSVGESTFTCLYAHSAVLADMKARLLVVVPPPPPNNHDCAPQSQSLEERMQSLRVDVAAAVQNSDCHATNTNTNHATAAQWSVFCCALALVEITEAVRGIILNADIYEEEDFAANTHGLLFFTTHNTTSTTATLNSNESSKTRDDGDDDNHQLLDTAELLRMTLNNLLPKELLPASAASDNHNDHVAALQMVLGYQLDFISICSSLARLAGGSTKSHTTNNSDLQRTVIAAQARVRTAVHTLHELQRVVAKLSVVVAGSISNNGDISRCGYSCCTTPEIESVLQQSFDSFVNRPLVGNLPVRTISFLRPASAIPILNTITSEIDTCVCNLLLRGSTLGRIQRMLDRLVSVVTSSSPSSSSSSACNILSRSLILLNLYFDERLLGQYDLCELLSHHVAQWQVSSSSSPAIADAADGTTTPSSSSEHAAAFLNRLAKPIYDTLKLKLLNRNRQRAYIEAVMLPEWVSLQNEAHLVDLHCHRQSSSSAAAAAESSSSGGPPSTYLTRYVLAILIRLMDRYVEAGLEVGLFLNSHHDLSFAFWYRDFLLSALNQNLSVMRQTKELETIVTATRSSHDTSNNSTHSKWRGKKKHHQKNKIGVANGKHGHNAIDSRPPSAEDLEDGFELKIIAVKRNMCRKTIQFLAALTQAGILKEQQFEFTSLERIFEKRFEVFGAIRQPPPLTYQHYLEGNDFSRVPPNDLLQTVTEGFQYCRASIEQILQDASQQKIDPMYTAVPESELRALIKVCIGNSVYVQKLRQIADSGEAAKAKAVFDFNIHDQFCIIKVVL